MIKSKFLYPLANELPSHFADRLGIHYTSLVKKGHKKEKGQFFTPIEISRLMGSFASSTNSSLRILDPGCGTVILSCALIENLVTSSNLESIELVAYETDNDLVPFSKQSLEYLREWLFSKKINFRYLLNTDDFILENATCLSQNQSIFSDNLELFDIIISNPPYFKLPIEDKRAIAAKAVVNGHPNIYAIFMAISAKLLKEDGELIFITPRSYASGSYFKLFREYFFKIIEIDNVHLFVSRKETFTRDKVLQETVIIKGKRKRRNNPEHKVAVSSSQGLSDILTPEVKIFEQKILVDVASNERILYLPTNDFEESIINIFKNWNSNLNKCNIQISTGPVVAFRSKEYIQENYQNGTIFLAPLFWLHNVKQMALEWPVTKPNKGQYVRIENDSKAILIPNKNYILLRRFSSKDDKSRLVAAPYFSSFIKSEYIGVENKVNYIYRPKGHLDRNEVVGLCALLNSTLFDSFFRIFNGNVNVSATELREIPLPPLEIIKEIGDIVIISNDFSVENVNKIVIEQFELSTSLYE
ncbi:MAG TPA: Eco57I restriction-modification methylase domain-containing protein [Bacteroidia bacterium]|jgi:adenine-specific DNA-methyltransferase|nr:Eco57I restriction-modification methylase domain-containing protein [Bacteroidia bacterium]